MNDIFSIYCPNTNQPPDLRTMHQSLDIQSPSASAFFNGQTLSNDLTGQQQAVLHRDDGRDLIVNNSNGYNNTHNNIPFVQIHTTDVQPQRNYGNVFRRAITNNQAIIKSEEPIKSESADSSKERTNGTPTPPVRNLSCNSSERIATPASTQNDIEKSSLGAIENVVSSSFQDINIHKCNQCRYLCLNQIDFDNHIAKTHRNQNGFCVQTTSIENEPNISCAGCSNIFYTIKSYEVHLLEDHLVSENDVGKMIAAIQNKDIINTSQNMPPTQQRKSRIYLKNVECLREPHREPMDINGPANGHVTDGFFLTNNFTNLERNADLNEILNNDFNENEAQRKQNLHNECNNTMQSNNVEKPKQKISIKSVDVLREPALLRRDFEMQCQNQFVSNNEHQFDAFNVFQNISNSNIVTNNSNNNNNNNNASLLNNTNDTCHNFMNTNNLLNDSNDLEKSRRPKIYIKNVDILKEPMVLPNFGPIAPLNLPENDDSIVDLGYNFLTNVTTDFIGNAANMVTSNVDVFDTNVINHHQLSLGNGNLLPESYLYETPHIVNNNCNNNNNNEIDIVSRAEVFSTYNNPCGNINTAAFGMSYPTMLSNACNGVGNNVGGSLLDNTITLSTSTTPIMTEPTPPPPSQPPSLSLSIPISVSAFNMQNMADTLNTTPTITTTPPFATTTTTTTNNGNIQSNLPIQQQKQKIFIKNVDILKEPQFQVQRERGTLHLRTVDELNLMNRNEVESLIAPNLEHSSVNNITSLQNSIADNNEILEDDEEEICEHERDHEEEHQIANITTIPTSTTTTAMISTNSQETPLFYEDDTLKLHDYAQQLVNSWTTDDYDLGNDIDCIITDSINEPMNQLAPPPQPPPPNHYMNTIKINNDLETPQMSGISIRDIEELTGTINQTLEMEKPCINIPNYVATNLEEQQKPCHGNNILINENNSNNNNNIITSTTPQQQQMPSTFLFNIPTEIPPLTPLPTINNSSSNNNNNNNINFSISNKLTNREQREIETMKVPLPRLVPVSNIFSKSKIFKSNTTTATITTTTTSSSTTTLAATATTTTTTSTSGNLSNTGTERGRIYVANNLMQVPTTTNSTSPIIQRNSLTTTTTTTMSSLVSTSTSTSASTSNSSPEARPSKSQKRTSSNLSTIGGTSVRGRPFGSNRSENATKPNKPRLETNEIVLKCSVRGCAFRFKKPETLAYHQRCHDSSTSSWQAKLCPECNSKDFSNWNTLHTHLWRTHQIDMELYSCTLCPFKTPIYSRLVNTHTKIHSEERNYKCEQCAKAFKNTKQLKNHRRCHRVHHNNGATVNNSSITPTTTSTVTSTATTATAIVMAISTAVTAIATATTTTTSTTTTTNATATTATTTLNNNNNNNDINADLGIILKLHCCNICGAAFSHSKTLREHNCKKSDNQLSCSICGNVSSSKSSLKLHMFTHENAKRLRCTNCTYSTSDHNAFRRHKMTHENTKMYECPHCSYKSIQSAVFQKHVLQKHPDAASTIVHTCKICPYSTVNRILYAKHQMQHKELNNLKDEIV